MYRRGIGSGIRLDDAQCGDGDWLMNILEPQYQGVKVGENCLKYVDALIVCGRALLDVGCWFS